MLGSLIGGFCGGEATKLNDLTGAFADQGARQGLGRLLDKGKLGDAVEDPSCLAEIAGRIDPATTATVGGKSGKLAALCKGLSESDCTKLGGMVGDGGLGAEPKVLGELIGRGCKGDPTKVSGLATAFPGKTENDALKAALVKGGLGTTDDTGKATNTDPQCLAHLLDPGCKQKGATDLATLLTSLNDTDRTAMKDVMVTGKLGTRPEVLGNLYGTGCQQDPLDPTQGQNPAVMKKLMETFSVAKDAQGPQKFDALLDRGGLADKPEWLGKVVRDAFTTKTPPGVQAPEKLKDLYNAFNPGNVDKLADLKTMVTAIDATPAKIGPGGEPGKGLQNILQRSPPAATSLPISDLQTRFFVGLDTRAGATAGTATVGGVPWLGRDELIQNAATFEGHAEHDRHAADGRLQRACRSRDRAPHARLPDLRRLQPFQPRGTETVVAVPGNGRGGGRAQHHGPGAGRGDAGQGEEEPHRHQRPGAPSADAPQRPDRAAPGPAIRTLQRRRLRLSRGLRLDGADGHGTGGTEAALSARRRQHRQDRRGGYACHEGGAQPLMTGSP